MSTFAQYATATAFSISLSKRQCDELLRQQCYEATGEIGYPADIRTLSALEARGLIPWTRTPEGQTVKYNGLTEAGKLLAQLLVCAGLSIQNTETVTTLRGGGMTFEDALDFARAGTPIRLPSWVNKDECVLTNWDGDLVTVDMTEGMPEGARNLTQAELDSNDWEIYCG